MARMATLLGIVWVGLVLAVVPASADEDGWSYDEGLRYESADGKFDVELTNRLQFRLTADDPDLGDRAESFDIVRYKLTLAGRAYEHWAFRLQADVARGSESGGQLLEDAFVVWDRHRFAQVWLGQGKVFFGRQALTNSTDLQFVDRSLATEEFWHTRDGSESRDVGVALMGEGANKRWQYQVGAYNGNGINKDEKDNSDYMLVGRVVITPFGEVPLLEVDPTRPDSPRLAVGLSAMSLTKGTEALDEEVEELTAGFEVFFQLGGFNFLAEYFSRDEDLPVAIPDDEADVDGWYAQAGYLLANGFGVAGRYSATSRDTAGTEPDTTEAGVALSYYLRQHRHKIQADYRQLEFDVEPMGETIDTGVLRVQLQLSF